jgi:hypothetical protein
MDEQILAGRIRALAPALDDSSWADVVRRTEAPSRVRRRSRRRLIAASLLALAVAVLLAAVVGPALGVGRPWWEGRPMQDVVINTAVPGLTYPFIGYAVIPGTPPSVEQCVTGWNTLLPAATRKWLAARSLDRASVLVMTQGPVQIIGSGGPVQTIGSNRPDEQAGALCTFLLSVGTKQVLVAGGPWLDTGHSTWRGEITTYPGAAPAPHLEGGLDGLTVTPAAMIRLP